MTDLDTSKKSVSFYRDHRKLVKGGNKQSNSLRNFERYQQIWGDQKEKLSSRTGRVSVEECLLTKTEMHPQDERIETRKMINYVNDIEHARTYRNNETQNIWAKTLRREESAVLLKPKESVTIFSLDQTHIPTKKADQYEIIRRPTTATS
jgi:hypothetical protein